MTIRHIRPARAVALAAVLAPVIALALAPRAHAAGEPLTLVLDWFLNPDHAPLVVAQERGYFEEAGVEVRMREPADPNNPPKLVAAGKADLAITYQPNLHMQVDQGLPLKRIATLVATPLNTLLALKGGPVEGIADLEDRKIGYSVGGFEDALLGRMLEGEGLGLADVELVNVNFSLSPALLSGRVAAVIGAFRNFELNQLEIEGAEGLPFYPEEHGVPAYDELVIVANAAALDDPRLSAFLTGLERGVQYLVNHPEKSWRLFAEAHPDLDDELNRKAWRDTLPRFALRPAALDTARYRRFAEFLARRGLIGEARPVEAYAVELPRE